LKAWYEVLFQNYAESYDKEPFTQGTIGEVDFIEKELDHDRSKTILDIGCGTGRHAIELASRGYSVTGIDLSESQLARARQKAKDSEVNVQFLKRDAREFTFKNKFDAIIMLCEGAFSLMETDEMNYQILRNAEKSLKKGGIFIFSCLNALFPLYHSVKDFLNAGGSETTARELTFDLMTFREHSKVTFTDDSGRKNTIDTNERYFTPVEITWLLKSLQFTEIGILGCKLGNFSREHLLTTDDFEMLVVARK
jgi:2-polyprenyl-3-methyl-5-hydroxy-6-metoxy-1,4-benzoquinol methylase